MFVDINLKVSDVKTIFLVASSVQRALNLVSREICSRDAFVDEQEREHEPRSLAVDLTKIYVSLDLSRS